MTTLRDFTEINRRHDQMEAPEYWEEEEETMPMDFPDMKSLERCAEGWRFRKPNEGETEAEFRTALADFVASKDFVESCEIRNKVGWDRFTDRQNLDMLRRSRKQQHD